MVLGMQRPDMSHEEHNICFLNPGATWHSWEWPTYPFLLTSRVNAHVAIAAIMPTTNVRINVSLCLLSSE